MARRHGRATGTADRSRTIRAVARSWEVALALLSLASVIAALFLVRTSALAVGLLFVAALGVAVAPFVIVALATGPGPARPVTPTSAAVGSVTTIVRVGGEPRDLVEACVALATRDGPTVVVTAARDELVAELEAVGATVHTGASVEEALTTASQAITTTAVLVVQPSALPVAAMCVAAAGQLDTSVGWVIGRVREFEDEGYAPDCREILGARLRTRVRAAGLELWERDATLVRTELLRRHPLTPGRPWGAWLRARVAEGHLGAEVDAPFALRVVPAGATVFWPATVARQRALAADLAGAAAHGAPRARLLAIGLLCRELYAYPLAVLLLAPLLLDASGAFPFTCPPAAFLAVAAGLAAARWVTQRATHGVALHPVDELVAAADDAPGSVQALAAACTRRVGTARGAPSQRLLAWAMLAFSVAALVPLADRTPDPDGERIAAGLALVVLALLWMFALRVFAQLRWTRRVGRAGITLATTVQGRAGRTIDASPSGLAVVLPGAGLAAGDRAEVAVTFSDGTAITMDAVASNRRVVAGHEIIGLSLDTDPVRRAEWIRRVFDELHLDGTLATPTGAAVATVPGWSRPGGRHRAVEVADRVAIGLTVAVSLVVLGVLLLGALGFRTLVVRSSSMTPALHTGDLVLVEETRARDLRVGDVVAFDLPGGDDETIIHRVRHITVDGTVLTIETRGDANQASERWSTGTGSSIEVSRWRVPAVGRFVSWLRAPDARWVLLALAVALVGGTLLRAAFGAER